MSACSEESIDLDPRRLVPRISKHFLRSMVIFKEFVEEGPFIIAFAVVDPGAAQSQQRGGGGGGGGGGGERYFYEGFLTEKDQRSGDDGRLLLGQSARSKRIAAEAKSLLDDDDDDDGGNWSSCDSGGSKARAGYVVYRFHASPGRYIFHVPSFNAEASIVVCPRGTIVPYTEREAFLPHLYRKLETSPQFADDFTREDVPLGYHNMLRTIREVVHETLDLDSEGYCSSSDSDSEAYCSSSEDDQRIIRAKNWVKAGKQGGMDDEMKKGKARA